MTLLQGTDAEIVVAPNDNVASRSQVNRDDLIISAFHPVPSTCFTISCAAETIITNHSAKLRRG